MSKTSGYIALVHKDKDTSYGVSIPDVPGCISAGDTLRRRLITHPKRSRDILPS